MPVPKYDDLMLPILKHCLDGGEYRSTDFVGDLERLFRLSPDELAERIPSGAQTVLYNRIVWATVYLVKAGLLERPRRGFVRITERGRVVLSKNPSKIDNALLAEFPEFNEFKNAPRTPSDTKSRSSSTDPDDSGRTPEELIQASSLELHEALATELLDRVRQCSPSFFEQLVIDLLVGMGYGGSRTDAARAIGRSGDGGIDGIINEDRLGLDTICVQAKRWQEVIGRPAVQAFAGSIEGARAKKGVFITTSSFAETAKAYAASIEKRIVLIDGKMMANLMIEHGVGVSSFATYTLKRIDGDYFEPEE